MLAAALDGALRIMHPVLPFITETIFWKLNEVSTDRTIPGIIELTPSARLIRAAWPRRLNEWSDNDADKIVPQLQEIIGAIRNLRNEHKVDPKRMVTVSIKPTCESAKHIETNREMIELLAICTLKVDRPESRDHPKRRQNVSHRLRHLRRRNGRRGRGATTHRQTPGRTEQIHRRTERTTVQRILHRQSPAAPGSTDQRPTRGGGKRTRFPRR